MIIDKNNFFIIIKWIILLIIINNEAIAFNENESNYNRIDINSYISDYNEYNRKVLNKEESSKETVSSDIIEIKKISNSLNKVMNLNKKTSDRVSTIIFFASKKYNIDKKIMLSILKVESNFNQNAVNKYSCKRTNIKNCGDYSIAQINYETWVKSFPKQGRKELDFNRLKSDDAYAIFRMAEILSILKDNYSKNDKFWYARYHSSTEKFKKRYISMLEKEMKKLSFLDEKEINSRSISMK